MKPKEEKKALEYGELLAAGVEYEPYVVEVPQAVEEVPAVAVESEAELDARLKLESDEKHDMEREEKLKKEANR